MDCGANVGDITVFLAKTGAEDVALEPNPVAFAQLERRCAGYSNVRCLQVAAPTSDGYAPGLAVFVLRQSGPDVYDAWWQGTQAWNSAEIKEAFEAFGKWST